MKRYSNDREIRKLQEEYENSQKENRYPKFGAEDFADLAQYYYENGEPDTAKEVADTSIRNLNKYGNVQGDTKQMEKRV